MTVQEMEDLAQVIVDREAVAFVSANLSEFEKELLWMWAVEDRTLEEIGVQLGQKYWERPLSRSAMRYHKNRLLARLRPLAAAVGMDGLRTDV